MELQQIRYFKALAETGNLTKTADRLHITPPTLSISISRLEEELGAQLFDRIKGRLYLNEMGKVFLESSSTILNVLDSSCNKVRNISLLGKKTLMVSTAVSSFRLSELLFQYLESHPDVRLINKQDDVSNIETDLTERHFGFAISLAGVMDNKMLNSRMIGPENKVFYVGMSKTHPLARHKSVRLKDLRYERFIFPPADLPLTKSFYAICRNAGFEPDVVAECSTFLMTRFIEKGLGVTFVASAGFLNNETIVRVPVSDVRDFSQDRFAIYWSKKHQMSDVERDFLDFVTERFD
ncbi:MAG: LysR family transcriptional regulator [Sphaerochaetaceae bacterium]|nr:LysR family transcriptional regulator [Sphaerochaetaceae bacterium]